MHWLSVSLYRASPLYSFSQKFHTEERQIVRRLITVGRSASVLCHTWCHILVECAEEGFHCIPTFQRRNASRPNSSKSRMVRKMTHHGTPAYWTSRLSGNTVSLTCGTQTHQNQELEIRPVKMLTAHLGLCVVQHCVPGAVDIQRGLHCHHHVM